MTEKNISPWIDDKTMISKINQNRVKLRFEQELKELYDRKIELKQIHSEEEILHYVGSTFRQWYRDLIEKEIQGSMHKHLFIVK